VAVHPEANNIFGAVIDDTLGDEVRVTVIAAGFDGGEPVVKKAGYRSNFVDATVPVAAAAGSGVTAVESDVPDWGGDTVEVTQEPYPAAQHDPVFESDDDDLDIPDFLK
jgi:cell division protein FtsZ